MSANVIAMVCGFLIGAWVWWAFMLPSRLREYERKRRQAGLPPRRKLPEDES